MATSPESAGSSPAAPRPRTALHYALLRCLLAAILLAAAVLEAHRLATEPLPGSDLFSQRWLRIALVEFEILLGAWLLAGIHRRLGWLVALACFLTFSAVTLVKALQGHASCGCFGKIQVNPWHTLVLDLSAVLALLAFRPNLRHPDPCPRYRPRLLAAIAAVLAVGSPLALAMASFRPAAVDEQGRVSDDDSIVLLEPERWTGKRFPLLGHLDLREPISRGRWALMIVSDSCSSCAQALPRFRRLARPLQDKHTSLALIHLPPHRPSPGPSNDGLLHATLDARRQWFVSIPTVLLLQDGTVLAAWEGDDPDLNRILPLLP